MEQKLVFKKKQEVERITLNPENTFFKITKVAIHPKDKNDDKITPSPITIKYKVSNIDESYISGNIHELSSSVFTSQNYVIDINKIISDKFENTIVEIEYHCNESFDCEVILHYTTFDQKVEFKNPFQDFRHHLKFHDNVKILFSAPYGQGKTTFLNHFFSENNGRYEVFKLYPVNYAVSHNEDIFKYIKAGILFQLMGKDVEFDKIQFNLSETVYSYYSQNANKIISPLLSMIPKIGESVSKIYDKLFEISETLQKHKQELDIDDKNKALKFIHDLYEKEGSIFEDNFYTQLIRQLLEQHKEKYKKQSVLIIDDIDRMDPDHIFRIFNVFRQILMHLNLCKV